MKLIGELSRTLTFLDTSTILKHRKNHPSQSRYVIGNSIKPKLDGKQCNYFFVREHDLEGYRSVGPSAKAKSPSLSQFLLSILDYV